MIKSALALLALMLVVSVAPAQTRVPTLDDLLTLKSIGATQISPDGKRVAFTLTSGNTFSADIHVMNIDGTGVTNLSNTPGFTEQLTAWPR